jgi:tetratricopeptide (TPR) repeat protein
MSSTLNPLAPASTRSPWISRPWLDLLIGCGAWSAPLLLLTAYVSSSKTASWSFAFYFIALLCNYPHFMATVYRAYHSYDEFSKYKFFTVHIAVLLAITGLIAHLWYPLLPWIFTLYICWSPWHYTGQNFGIMMMFARRAGISPTEQERRALHLSFIASYILLMLSFHTGSSPDPLILSLGLAAKFTLPARAVLAIFFLGASAWALVSLSRRTTWKALLPAATLVSTQFLWFLLPALIELFSNKEVPQTRYSSGILAILHSAQYLWITNYYQKKEALAAGNSSWSFPRYLLTLVAGGIALFVPGPWLASRIFHADFASSFLTFTALVNIHHFILDGAIWKLRDSRIASHLLNKRETAEEVAVATPNRFIASLRWLAGTKTLARTLRVTFVALLLLWGAVDLLHFYWANVSANLSALQRAALLNPDDSQLQSRLARIAEAAGNRDAALSALRHAAAVNPENISLQEAYARGLITSGRDSEAYAFYQNLLLRAPNNVDALVNYGLLAQHLGHGPEAIDSWQRAVTADPTQSNAQLYLAQALEQSGETQAAAHHYRSYLQIVSTHKDEHRAEMPTVISSLIKVADADAEARQFGAALRGYLSAAQFAQKIGNPNLQSLAIAHAADAQERSGEPGDASQSFQQALILDETQGDSHVAASDWFNYAQFLRRHEQPEKLIFACLLRAEDHLTPAPVQNSGSVAKPPEDFSFGSKSSQELGVVTKARQDSESRLGRVDAQKSRDHLATLLSQALSLPPSAFSNPSP